MIKTFLRPNLIKRINIRTNCNLKCNDKCANLMRAQNDTLNKILNNARTIAIITFVNFMTPVALIVATSIADFIALIK